MKRIDVFLNAQTMYRTILLALGVTCVTAVILSAVGLLDHRLGPLLSSLGLIVAVGYAANAALSRLFRSGAGTESWLISSLILFLILKPAQDVAGYAVLAVGVTLVMASKYVLALSNRHVFNPVAIALVILGLLGSGEVYWWVGSKIMLPVVLIVGMLVLRKTRRFHLFWPFVAVAVITRIIGAEGRPDVALMVRDMVVSGPIMFFATIMLTEPATAPPTRTLRMVYAGGVGLLFGLHFSFGPLYSSPELALVVGNAFSYLVSSKRRLVLRLENTQLVGAGVYQFRFSTDGQALAYAPGQFMEWTLPHKRPDSRGNRRYFTVASSPTEPSLMLAARIDPIRSSSFKKNLLAMQPGDELWASQINGDFCLPRDTQKKLVFIAGGIGITPFRSMVQSMIDTTTRRNITLFYNSQTADGFAFWPVFNAAVGLGLRPLYIISGKAVPEGWTGKIGYITAEMITAEVPDYLDSTFYLSGPNVMVQSYKKLLRSMGVSNRHIKSDFFPGF